MKITVSLFTHLVPNFDHLFVSQILDTEERILNTIDFKLTVPTAHCFLLRFLKAAGADTDKTVADLASMVLDSSLLTFSGLTCTYLPSQLAAGAIMVARRSVGNDDWSATLTQYSHYDESEAKRVAKAIMRAKDNVNPDLIALHKKYSKSKYGKVCDVELASMYDEDFPDMQPDFYISGRHSRR